MDLAGVMLWGASGLTSRAFVLGLLFFAALLASLIVGYLSLAHQMNVNRNYDAFIATVSHELKSPLAAIRLHLDTFRLRRPDEERSAGILALMVHDTDRLERLTNTVLDVARLEERRKVGKLCEYPAEELVRGLVRQTMADFSVTEWTFDSHSCDGSFVRANQGALKQVFDILVDNAVKYSVGEAHLRLHCAVERKRFLVEIADEGIGIPKEQLRKIFHKFYRVHDQSRTSPNVQGTGLGLFWAQQTIQAHHGRITAQSGGERKGSLFRITLPVFYKRNGHLARRTTCLTKTI